MNKQQGHQLDGRHVLAIKVKEGLPMIVIAHYKDRYYSSIKCLEDLWAPVAEALLAQAASAE